MLGVFDIKQQSKIFMIAPSNQVKQVEYEAEYYLFIY